MPRQIDELLGLDRAEDLANAVDAYIVNPFRDAKCKVCGDQGLFDMICPGCGKWDLRTMDEIEDLENG
jgi:hypothetical protein